ncbi:MAG TPA: GNAT family N-acetyltransferase [Burkholderiales bacterium]|nr:GNAT family N-acetyltransferase [Burkholderiales bacterium]
MTTVIQDRFHTHRLVPADLAAVVAIDAALSGRSRSAYFERRLAAARREPDLHLQLAVDGQDGLAGFMLGRLLEGEFGRSEAEVRLEAFGIRAASQHQGLGSALAGAFEGEAARFGAAAIRTTARWREHELLRFLDHAGYSLAGEQLLDCQPHDYAADARDAVEIEVLQDADLEGVARIDARHTGRDRRGYLCRALREALADSAVRVSLVARIDGGVAGFLMARMDYGDFGRVEPSAVIDTVGVDPLRARQGIGRALLSQLLLNLRALGAERVETAVAPGDLPLIGYFHDAGFRPSERLSFVKPLGRAAG